MVLGNEDEMTLSAPGNVDGKLQGGTNFERLGQDGVKGTRCYSMSTIHQAPRGLVGPTAGGKVYDGGITENEVIRKHFVKVQPEYTS
jgi:hypothetical protein